MLTAVESRVSSPKDLFITPLMSIIWFFNLDTVVKYRYFMDDLRQAKGMNDISRIYTEGRRELKLVDKYSGDYKGKRLFNNMFGI